MDFEALAAHIALEAELALELNVQINKLDERIAAYYKQADPQQNLTAIPGVGQVLAAQIVGRLGNIDRFSTLSSVRSYSGLVPRCNSSGLAGPTSGLCKMGMLTYERPFASLQIWRDDMIHRWPSDITG